jgi:hypothetical protein
MHRVDGCGPLRARQGVWLGRVDEFEVLTTKSMTCGKIGFATNSSKINGLVLIRQHALGGPNPTFVSPRAIRGKYRQMKDLSDHLLHT